MRVRRDFADTQHRVGAGLVEEAGTTRYRNARKYRYRRPYYVPYACSPPYQYRYWQFYAPICYPLWARANTAEIFA